MTRPSDRPLLGLIEGFYGPPWTWHERERMMGFLGVHGFDLYVYAPKDDPLHRARWRDPLPPDELDRFERLARRAATAGVELSYGLSPVDLAIGDRAGVLLVVRKCLQLVERGVHSFCLLFDDLPQDLPPGPDERSAAARWQARVANEVLHALRRAGASGRFAFCPTEYSGWGPTPTPYLRALGATLATGIEVFWTGPQVCSGTIQASDLAAVSEGLQRPPLLWDNYPVNDGEEMRWDPHIRPLRGRTADLPAACSGIVANGAIQAEATKIALHTLAAYWRDPSGYDPEAAWGPALLAVSGDAGDADALRTLGLLTRRSPIEPGGEPPVPWLDAFWRRWDGVTEGAVEDSTADATVGTVKRAAVEELKPHLRRAGAAATRLVESAEKHPLAREMRPWAAKMGTWEKTVRSGLDLLLGEAPPADVEHRLGLALAMPHRVSDAPFEAFVRRCLAVGPPPAVTHPR